MLLGINRQKKQKKKRNSSYLWRYVYLGSADFWNLNRVLILSFCHQGFYRGYCRAQIQNNVLNYLFIIRLSFLCQQKKREKRCQQELPLNE